VPVSNSSEDPQFRIAVLISGSGRTLENILATIARGDLAASVVQVISSRPRVRGNEIAERYGIPLEIVPRRRSEDPGAFSDAVFEILDSAQPDLVACAGFLSQLRVPDRYMGKIVNIHPSLLPLFGGRGYYGDRVHQSVLDSGMKVTGCTVHYVDNEYDAGPIIAQACVPVEEGDTTETLARRVFAAECELYPRVLQMIASGRVLLDGRSVRVLPPDRTERE
jgi:phosphoribosylglycinamide formyltransferase 1